MESIQRFLGEMKIAVDSKDLGAIKKLMDETMTQNDEIHRNQIERGDILNKIEADIGDLFGSQIIDKDSVKTGSFKELYYETYSKLTVCGLIKGRIVEFTVYVKEH